MKKNFANMREDFIQKKSIHNNIFQFSHRYYGLAATKWVVQAIFHVFQRTISAIQLKELFRKNGI